MKRVSSIILSIELLITCSACGTTKAVKDTISETRAIISESQEALKEAQSTITIQNTTIQELTSKIKEKKETTTKDPYIVKNLGTFSLTFYTPYEDGWGYNTATGVKSQHLKTCAVDPCVIPYGSVLKITGDNGQVLMLKAIDCGGGIKGNKIDIFMDCSQKEGYSFMAKFGQIHSVYLLEE